MIEEPKQKIKNIISRILPNVKSTEIDDYADIFSLGLDSINVMTLITSLQETFNFQLEVHELNFENFQTVSTILAMVEKKNLQL